MNRLLKNGDNPQITKFAYTFDKPVKKVFGSQKLRRCLQGLMIAIGAPIGWVLLELLRGNNLHQAISQHLGLLSYLLFATAAAFGSFGCVLGWKEDQLDFLNIHLKSLAITDELTQIPNRRLFMSRLSEELSLSQRLDLPLSLGFLDLDKFKRVNDTYGHEAGDRVLRAVSDAMASVMRSGEVLARIGGDEFGILLLGEDNRLGQAACQRLCSAVDSVRVVVGDDEIRVGMSAGVASTSDIAYLDEKTLMERADRYLYMAKRSVPHVISALNVQDLGVDLHVLHLAR